MATAAVTKNAKAKAEKKAGEQREVQRMAYQGYCIAVGFDRSLAKAQQMLEAAKAQR
ncbi:MAG TPA: hypothetical protein VFA67_06825 [Candidatus Sulfotelmatobacter sp.]|nr:hypothetical protein [Candidatus Sulfotelmatobacter sp.]